MSQDVKIRGLAQGPVMPVDELASHPDDPGRVAAGVALDDGDWPAAEQAAREALERFPDVPRFRYLLARCCRNVGNAEEERQHLRRAAEEGYPQAMLEMSADEPDGRMAWLTRAAEAGHPVAMGLLARTLLAGLPLEGDAAEALHWLERGAEAGDALSMVTLAPLHGAGRYGLALDRVRAFELWLCAAEAGDVHAQYVTGCCLEAAAGVARDLPRARIFLKKAHDAGHPQAGFRLLSTEGLGQYFDLDADLDLERLDTPDQADPTVLHWLASLHEEGVDVPQDDEKVEHYLRRAIEAGNIEAALDLGSKLREEGQGEGGQDDEAWALLRRAAIAGQPHAQFLLGDAFELGTGVKQDPAQARLWYQRAAESGHTTACLNLGYLHATGALPDSDLTEGMRWYERAAELGNIEAMVNLAARLMAGRDLEEDHAKARAYAEQAAAAGHPHAFYILACLYSEGSGGLAKDEATTQAMLREAARRGDPHAIEALAQIEAEGPKGAQQDEGQDEEMEE